MERLLRVGVLEGGRLVEERVLRQRGAVTVGPSAGDTFILPMAPGSRSRVLFSDGPGGHQLHLAPGLEGRVVQGHGQAPVALSELQGRDGRQRVALGAGARGKLLLGETTILFQLVVPPPATPRPRLPASMRGSLRGNLDWILIGVVGASVLAHTAFVVALRSVDLPRRPDIEDVPMRTATASVRLWHPTPEPEVKPAADKKIDPNQTKVATHHTPRAPSLSEAEKLARDQARATLDRERRDRDVKRAVASVIGVKGVQAVLHDNLRDGDPAHDNAKAFEGVRGTTTAKLDRGLHPKDGYGGPPTKIKATDDLTKLALNEVESGDKKEGTVKPRIQLPTGPLKPDTENPCSSEPIVDGIRQRKGGLVACYERALHRDPTLQGKVRLHFSVTGAGRISDVDLEEDTVGDEEMASCIVKTTRAWVFAHVEACGKMQFSYPIFFTPAGSR